MGDIFIDKILHNKEVEDGWFETTKDLIKLNGFNKVINKVLKASAEVSDEYYSKNRFPKHFFKGDLRITDIADEFGIKPLKRKLRLCPFHIDKNKSLSLSNEKGVFNCFGCGAKGNIITFNAMLKKVKKDGNK